MPAPWRTREIPTILPRAQVSSTLVGEEVRQAFAAALDLPAETDIEALEIGGDPAWDSVGHMALVAELESRFGIVLETDDLVAMSSYAKAVEILRRYGVAV
jgi:acyl carrier protein